MTLGLWTETVNIVTAVVVLFFGLAVGSFLNVVIYRLPLEKSIVVPGSFCPACGAPIRFYDNIPVVSYIILMGRCRSCYARISLRYPLVEAAVGLMALILFLKNGLSPAYASDFILIVLALAVAIIDAEHMIIPDRLTYTGAAMAFILTLLYGFHGVMRGVAGGLLGSLILLGMYGMGKALFKREGVGLGDVKFAFVIGLFNGPLWCFIALTTAVIFGGLWSVFQLATGKKTVGMQIPFGPFMSFGVFCVVFFRVHLSRLIELYMGLFKF